MCTLFSAAYPSRSLTGGDLSDLLQIDTVLCGVPSSSSSSSSSEDECMDPGMAGTAQSAEGMLGEASNVVPMPANITAGTGRVLAHIICKCRVDVLALSSVLIALRWTDA